MKHLNFAIYIGCLKFPVTTLPVKKLNKQQKHVESKLKGMIGNQLHNPYSTYGTQLPRIISPQAIPVSFMEINIIKNPINKSFKRLSIQSQSVCMILNHFQPRQSKKVKSVHDKRPKL